MTGRCRWLLGVLTICVAALFVTMPVLADPRADLDRAVAEIVKTSLGSAAEATAMEKAIVAARAVKPPPAVPDATIDHVGRAKAAVRVAKSPRDFLDAANAFGAAARIAPWVADYHFNRGVLLEKAEKYDEAERALGLYLKAAPDAKDKNEVRERIAGLRYLKERAARPPQSTPQSAAVPPKPTAPAGPRIAANSLAGLWKIEWSTGRDRDGNFWRDVFELQPVGGNRATLRFVRSEGGGGVSFYSEISLTIDGLKAEGDRTWRNGNPPEHMAGAVSADGRSIFVRSTRDPRRTMLFVRYP